MIQLKKILSLVTVMALAVSTYSFGSSPAYAAGKSKVSININGKRLNTDADPFIRDGRTLVPVRGVFEELGSSVDWQPDSSTVVVKYKNTTINLKVGSKSASVNGSTVVLDVAPEIDGNRTMIPLRFIGENLGMSVQWVPEAGLATITDPQYFNTLPEEIVLGFTTNDYQGDNAPHNSLTKYSSSINSIATFSYQIDSNGGLKLTGQPQTNSVKFANSNGIKPLLLIHNFNNGNFDLNLSHAVLSDASTRKKLIDNILLIMSKEEYSGVNIDIENIYWYNRDNYTSFIKDLKARLAPYGFLTTLSVPAKTYDSYKNNNWSGAFDYPEIGKYADKILLMTYDEHYFGGAPGPVASLPWVEKVLAYASSVIPSKKLLLGIPGYGYDWASTGSKTVTFKNADGLMASTSSKSVWDDNEKSPYFTYTRNGVKHTVWYEDVKSLSNKLPLVEKYNLGGIGIWKLGYDNDRFWEVVNSIMN